MVWRLRMHEPAWFKMRKSFKGGSIMKGNRFALFVLVVIIFVLLSASCSRAPQGENPARSRIGIVYIGPHELINQIITGFRDGIAQQLPAGSYDIVERHANGDQTQISATINGAIASKLNVLATITTPVSQQAIKNAPKSLPVVFVGVTDPIGAGLVKSMEKPELTTGVSDVAPLQTIMDMIKQITPKARRIGFPYSPDEQPALYSRSVIERLAPTMGYSIDARPVTSKDEVATIVRDMARSDDAILVGADNKMFEAAPLIAKIALDGHKPFYSADSSSVKAGAVAGVTVDYTQIGRAGADIVVRVIKGERAGAIPVQTLTQGNLEINQTSLQKLGINLPPSVAAQVKATYK
jgi:putative tryptophan/tyrosine transport system substrate-binding protein